MTMTLADMPPVAAGEDGGAGSQEGLRSGRPKRRSFPAEDKTRILEEYEALESGRDRGALLRREGLYGSHIADWRGSRDAGVVNALVSRPAGRLGRSAVDAENKRLRKQNEQLGAGLARTKAARCPPRMIC